MELTSLEGRIIGIFMQPKEGETYDNLMVKEIITSKISQAMQMVNLPQDLKDKYFKDLSTAEKQKVILASKLNDKVIILQDFTKGLIYKDLIYLKNLLKKISTYNRKIILISKDIDFFLNLVDHLYVIEDQNIIYETTDLLEEELYEYIERPLIIEFVYLARQKGIKLPYYSEFNDLLKAIYRLKA